MIQRNCLCGSSLKLSGFADDPTAAPLVELWEDLHVDHQDWCSPADARAVRDKNRAKGTLTDDE